MATPDNKYQTGYKAVTVRTTDGSTFIGKVNLGVNQRVSDLFTKTTSPFIVLVDVEHSQAAGKVLVVNKNHIVWVEPGD